MRATIALSVLLLLTACGGDDDAEGEVEDAAQEQVDRFTSGDFGGAWGMWTDESKELFSRGDYIALNEACDRGGIPLDVADVRFEDDDTAIVRIGLGDLTQAYTMELEDGEWRWVPSDESQESYAKGLEAAKQDC